MQGKGLSWKEDAISEHQKNKNGLLQSGKLICGPTNRNLTFFLGNHGRCILWTKEEARMRQHSSLKTPATGHSDSLRLGSHCCGFAAHVCKSMTARHDSSCVSHKKMVPAQFSKCSRREIARCKSTMRFPCSSSACKNTAGLDLWESH